jgi:hypothetical protein
MNEQTPDYRFSKRVTRGEVAARCALLCANEEGTHHPTNSLGAFYRTIQTDISSHAKLTSCLMA